MTWTHHPVGKYVLIEWRAADHGADHIDRGEVIAFAPGVTLTGVIAGQVVVFRSGSVTQTGPLGDDNRLQMLIHADDIVAIATPVVT